MSCDQHVPLIAAYVESIMNPLTTSLLVVKLVSESWDTSLIGVGSHPSTPSHFEIFLHVIARPLLRIGLRLERCLGMIGAPFFYCLFLLL